MKVPNRYPNPYILGSEQSTSPLPTMQPPAIYQELSRDVIGQESILRYVSVAIFKHLQGEPFGNLLLIGNSGTGKTTTMRSVERLYSSEPAFENYRNVVILNANVLADEEGNVDTQPLLARLEERSRRILGPDATPQQIAMLMEHSTVCIDEVDKISGMVGGKPYVTGINIQQVLLTLIEGEKILYPVTVTRNGVEEKVPVTIDSGHMLYICAGAFETLYEQVFQRVTSPKSGIKLPKTTVYEDGKVKIREHFTLLDHFRLEDLFDYGMHPQFLSRFDNSIILEDLDTKILQRIFLETRDSVFQTSKNFFKKYGIDLDVTEQAAHRIAREAANNRRIGARALKTIYGRIIKPFEFDPHSHPEVVKNGNGYKLQIDEEIVLAALAEGGN